MKLNKYKTMSERLEETDIAELSDIGLKFLADDIALGHTGRRVDSDLAVEKLREITAEMYRRLRK